MPVLASKPTPPKPLLKKAYSSADLVKAVDIVITLEDGSRLVAKEGHATDIYSWLMDCERYCASNPGTVSGYQGPPFNRIDPEGNKVPMRRERT